MSAPSSSTTPGSSGTAPGSSGTAPGSSGTAPGSSGSMIPLTEEALPDGDSSHVMAGGGCIPQLLGAARAGGYEGGPAAAMDDLVGETILGFLTISDAMRSAATCKAAAAAQKGAADFKRIAGMRFRHLDLVLLQLPKFRSLRHLDLGGHDGLGPHCQQLASALMELSGAAATGKQARSEERQPMSSPRPRLRRLELAGCRIGTEGCYHLTRALEAGAGRSLTVLNLSANLLWGAASLSLVRALASGASPALLELTLANNFISAEGAAEIARALRAGGCNLRRLDLSSNELHAEGLAELLNAFLAGACASLEDLGLASNGLGVQGAMELGRALQQGFGPKLKRLDVASNGLGSLGIQVLMDATAAAAAAARHRHGRAPRERPFRYYHINPTLLAYQAQAQQQQQAQQPFHFLPPPHDSKTKQQQSPASPLANLQDFSLFLNDIKDAGAAGLALGLVQGLLPSLRELNVSANCLSPAGVVRIVSALETNCRSSSEVPLVNLSFNLLPEERGAVSHSALPQGVLL